VAVASAGLYASLQLISDNHANIPPLTEQSFQTSHEMKDLNDHYNLQMARHDSLHIASRQFHIIIDSCCRIINYDALVTGMDVNTANCLMAEAKATPHKTTGCS